MKMGTLLANALREKLNKLVAPTPQAQAQLSAAKMLVDRGKLGAAFIAMQRSGVR